MRSILLVVLLGGIATVAPAQDPKGQQSPPSPSAPASGTLATDEEKAIYAVGLSMWRTLAPLDLSPAEVEILKRALSDAVEGKAAISPQEAAPQVQALSRARAQRAIEKEKARSAAYLEKAEKEPGAVKFSSGLVFFDMQPGTGDAPQAGDTVKVHYRGTLADGTEFDSSRKRGEPAGFQLNRVIRCWTEGLQKMKVGGKARLLCPSSIAYGDRGFSSKTPGQPSIPGGAALAFEVELIEIVKAPPSPAAPKPPSGPR
jgi:FKBP-type peptidyl-prolyl cis-trans isomerase FkpA